MESGLVRLIRFESAAPAGVVVAGVGPMQRFADGVATADTDASSGERCLRAFARGMILGLPAGYVSHITLAAKTPRGVPLVTRGF